ncbi:MAG: alpha-glucosidase, partial [Phaeodactylibacter sp.]|nr:alpha-glucosidase [Phaeodactylibacter sp.]
MKNLKRIFLFTFLSLLLLLGVLAYINLREAREVLPETAVDYGNEPDYRQRQWWESTTVYQVYPRSFQDSNGDGIGDIAGIISRLDYIRGLGFETIWFSPFFESPQQDFGYDISDYYRADPVYGDSALIDSLIGEIHRRDMKVVFDMVLNHTSEQHAWFRESRSGRDTPRSDWYIWQDGKDGGPPNNWINALTQPAWNYDTLRGQWYYSAFLPFQPDLNWRNPDVKAAMFGMMRHWLGRGVDGFRLDIFNFIYEDEQFRDNPRTLRFLPSRDFTKVKGQNRIHNVNHPDNFGLAREMRSLIDEYGNPSRFLVGEVFGLNRAMRQFLGEKNDGLNLVFLFDITDFEWNAGFFRQHIRTFEAFYPYPYQPVYVFSNHDRPRSISRLGNDEQKAKLLALLQFTLRGVPFTYQGEEIGMRTGEIPLEEAKDPLPGVLAEMLPEFIVKNAPFVFNRDNCRTPMQWDGTANGGFTEAAATPWLPVQENADSVNVAAQQANENSLLNTYRDLLRLRQENLPLKWGSLQLVEEGMSGEVLGYQRIYREEQMAVYLNFSEEMQLLPEAGRPVYIIGEAILEGGRLKLGVD